MSIVYLGLGSNLGDREGYLRRALCALVDAGIKTLKVSSFIETDPVGGPVQGRFINAVVKAETLLSPMELLEVCLKIESALGRVRSVKDAPRTLDIDILMYDELILNSPELTIPHPRMRDRDFVMRPLKEVLS